ncbi:MAG: alpha/beta hydrolase [Candidatus Pacebacteria bacterium]|nr:alpha/beta hydrolase [Candidatus Paceibacterota bacterium]
MQVVNSQEKQTNINGLNINYKQIGNGNIPIVLLHGWGLSSDKYLELARWLHDPKLSDNKTECSQNAENIKPVGKIFQPHLSGGLSSSLKFQIIIPDLPGFGKSDEPDENWSLDDYVEFTDEFIKCVMQKRGFELVKNILKKMQSGSTALTGLWNQQEKKEKIILIGHSLGGKVVIRYAIKYPEKVDKLILTGAAGIKSKLTVKQKIFSILGKTGKIVFSLPVINNFRKPVYKIFSKIAQSRRKDYYYASPKMKEIMKNILAINLTDCLDKIKTPTLLIWGREDTTTPFTDGKVMNEKIENSELVIIDDANHSLPYQKPKEFAKIVEAFIR